jgi:NADPH:quinone reductase-like Zn-dependent oxidoreductase
MTRSRRILSGILVVLIVAIVSFGFVLSHNDSCDSASPVPSSAAQRIKAVVYRCYGPPEVLKVEEVEKPAIGDHQILVKVHATSINPLEWHYMRGTPYVMRLLGAGLGRPKNPRLGVDFAGTVEAVGSRVTKFRPGDAVFGGKTGALAEYVVVHEDRSVVPKPINITFEQAAAVPVAAVTALQALRDEGGLKSGQKALINGASGGVGTFAVQIAKSLGAEVTGVCSTRNVSLVRSLGADHVIDYTQEDFTQGGQLYDVILDMVGNHPLLSYRHILKPHGMLILIGGSGPHDDPWISFLLKPVKARALSAFLSQKYEYLASDINKERLMTLADLMQAGKVVPVVDRTYKLADISQAIVYLEAGHARGKVIISMDEGQ